MVTMYEVLQLIVGVPVGEYQELILYLVANVLSAVLIMYFLYIFRLVAGLINPKR